MNFKDMIIILVFIIVLVGVWMFIRLDANIPPKEAVEDKLEIPFPDKSAEGVNKTDNKTINNLDNKKVMQATLNTNKGDIVIEFFGDKTPNTVANFTKLTKEGFYNGVKFHLIIKGFMIQGGDPLTKDDTKISLWGAGGPGYKFADEIGKDNKNDIGTIAMANAGPNTNGSQFFINVAPNNFLDDKHTVFGKVISGMEVVKAIETTPTGAGDRPVSPVIINSITLK